MIPGWVPLEPTPPFTLDELEQETTLLSHIEIVPDLEPAIAAHFAEAEYEEEPQGLDSQGG